MFDKAGGRYFDEAKMHVLNHQGRFFKVRGPLNVAGMPQGHPVIVQAGASEQGRELGAATAEVIYAISNSLERARLRSATGDGEDRGRQGAQHEPQHAGGGDGLGGLDRRVAGAVPPAGRPRLALRHVRRPVGLIRWTARSRKRRWATADAQPLRPACVERMSTREARDPPAVHAAAGDHRLGADRHARQRRRLHARVPFEASACRWLQHQLSRRYRPAAGLRRDGRSRAAAARPVSHRVRRPDLARKSWPAAGDEPLQSRSPGRGVNHARHRRPGSSFRSQSSRPAVGQSLARARPRPRARRWSRR